MLVPAEPDRPLQPNKSYSSALGSGDVEERIFRLVVQQLVVDWLSTARAVIRPIARIRGRAQRTIRGPHGELLRQTFIDCLYVRNREVIQLFLERGLRGSPRPSIKAFCSQPASTSALVRQGQNQQKRFAPSRRKAFRNQ